MLLQKQPDELIFSEKYAQKSFNLHVDERTAAMEALYEGNPLDPTNRPESVQNLVQRYQDLTPLSQLLVAKKIGYLMAFDS